MADDRSHSSQEKSSTETYIPPPTDPYITYQTPYPRKPSEDIHNPFIEFRRLADAAFSSFFSGLPKVLGTEKFKEANIKESEQEFGKAFDQQARDFENRIAEMVRARLEEAEGSRKRLEQEFEERRRENARRMEEENQRWEMMKRGLEKCPGLRPDVSEEKREPETELDLYDGLKAYESASYSPEPGVAKTHVSKCPWKDEQKDKKCPWNKDPIRNGSWFSALGFDGMRRAKNIPLYASSNQDATGPQQTNMEWQEYNDEEMDPFTNDDHVVPWLQLSPYSPLSLLREQVWNREQNKNPRHTLSDAEETLGEMAWDEAFEDLMSLHKTGMLPSMVRRLIYWGGPKQWMTDMVLRGSFGPKWQEGFMVAALLGAVQGNHWKGFAGLQNECVELAGREFDLPRTKSAASLTPNRDDEDEFDNVDEYSHDYEDEEDDDDEEEIYPGAWANLAKEFFGPTIQRELEQLEESQRTLLSMRRLPERTFGAHGMSWPTPEEVIEALMEGESRVQEEEDPKDIRLVKEDRAARHLDASESLPSAQNSSSSSTDEAKSKSIISTMTSTTTRTLPDGSTEINRVLKKRFADGTAESSESTEVIPSHKTITKDVSIQTTNDKIAPTSSNQGGWFWN